MNTNTPGAADALSSKLSLIRWVLAGYLPSLARDNALNALDVIAAALSAPASVAGAPSEPDLIRAIRKLPMVRAREIDGEESDGTPISWRDRPFVSLTQLERLLSERAPSAAAPSAATGAIDARGKETGPVELRGIAETLENQDGCWRSCSGCHELNEGHDTGPYSAVLKCHLGGGCGECGGIGAVWDTTDYADMAAHALASQDEAPTPSAASAQKTASGIPLEAGIAWQAGAFDTERKAVTVEGHAWYRHDHPKVATPTQQAVLVDAPSAVPEGWQLVPVEPTEAMLDDGWDALDSAENEGDFVSPEGIKRLFRAMLQAATGVSK